MRGDEMQKPSTATFSCKSSLFFFYPFCDIAGGLEKRDMFIPGRKTHVISEMYVNQPFFLKHAIKTPTQKVYSSTGNLQIILVRIIFHIIIYIQYNDQHNDIMLENYEFIGTFSHKNN
jgi:hypothetical protein